MVVECVIVKSITGKNVAIEIDDCTDIAQLKTRYAALEGLSRERQRLIHKGRELQDNESLRSADLGRGAVIHAVPRLHAQRASSGPMQVTVCIPADGRILELQVESEDRTELLKSKVESRTGADPAQQIIHNRAGGMLHDGATLREHGVRDGDVLECTIKQRALPSMDTVIHSAPVSPMDPDEAVILDVGAQSAPVSPRYASSDAPLPRFPSIDRWADDDDLDLPIPPLPQPEDILPPTPANANSQYCAENCVEGTPAESTATPRRCPHDNLQRFTARDSMYTCSKCNEAVPLNQRVFACCDCGVDICARCVGMDSPSSDLDAAGATDHSDAEHANTWYPTPSPGAWGPQDWSPHCAAPVAEQWGPHHSAPQHWNGAPITPSYPVQGQSIPQGQPLGWGVEWDPAAKSYGGSQYDYSFSHPAPAFAAPHNGAWGADAGHSEAPARRRRRGGKNRGIAAKSVVQFPPTNTNAAMAQKGVMPPDYAIVPCGAEPAAAAA